MKASRQRVAIVLTFLTLLIVLNINSYQIAKYNEVNYETSINSTAKVMSSNKNIKETSKKEEKIDKIVEKEDKEEVVEVPEVENIVVEAEEPIVYDGMTLTQLGEKLERSMNSTLDGQGYNFASYAISLGMDPYLALAIVLEETGCTWGCSYLVNACNNIGGQKGYGCGDYAAFESLDAGIRAFLDNVYYNYYAIGLTTAELMNPKYAENPAWSSNVNAYITKIRNA